MPPKNIPSFCWTNQMRIENTEHAEKLATEFLDRVGKDYIEFLESKGYFAYGKDSLNTFPIFLSEEDRNNYQIARAIYAWAGFDEMTVG